MGLADLVGDGWGDVLAPVADRIAQLERWLAAEQAEGRLWAPGSSQIFAALAVPLADVRVLIVGQDPYPTLGHANGLAFAVDRAVQPLPRSLRNIHTELGTDLGIPVPNHGDLSAWTEQGVLLLNRVLTVACGAPGAHRGKGWEDITDAVVDGLLRDCVRRGKPLVALLWGRSAQQLEPRLSAGSAQVLSAPHPSPLSAHLGFFGSRPFSRTNALLGAVGSHEIDWELPHDDETRLPTRSTEEVKSRVRTSTSIVARVQAEIHHTRRCRE